MFFSDTDSMSRFFLIFCAGWILLAGLPVPGESRARPWGLEAAPGPKSRRKQQELDHKRFMETLPRVARYGTSEEILLTLKRLERLSETADRDRARVFLEKTLKQERPAAVRRGIISVIAAGEYKNLYKSVIPLVEDDDPGVSETALSFLKKQEIAAGRTVVWQYLQKQQLSEMSRGTRLAIQYLTAQKHPEFGKFAAREVVEFFRWQYPDWKGGEAVLAGAAKKKDKKAKKSRPDESPEPGAAPLAGEVLTQLVLALGAYPDAKTQAAIISLLRGTFHRDDPAWGELSGEPALKMTETTQSHLIYVLGETGAKQASKLLATKLDHIRDYPKEKMGRFFTMRNHILLALSKLGYAKSNEEIIATLRDDSASSRLNALELLRQARVRAAVGPVGYRARRDLNAKVRFEALRTLMEFVKPGSTMAGEIKGNLPNQATKDAARAELVKFLDYEGNKSIPARWLRHLGQQLYEPTVEKALVDWIQAAEKRYLTSGRQKQLVSVLAAFAKTRLDSEKQAARRVGPALEYLREIEARAKGKTAAARNRGTGFRRDGARHAARFVKRLTNQLNRNSS